MDDRFDHHYDCHYFYGIFGFVLNDLNFFWMILVNLRTIRTERLSLQSILNSFSGPVPRNMSAGFRFPTEKKRKEMTWLSKSPW